MIGDGVDAQREEMPVRVERKLGMRLVIAGLVVGDEALAPGGDPAHRRPQPARGPGDDLSSG